MAEQNKFRFVSYARDMKAQSKKFKQLDRLVIAAKTKGGVDAVIDGQASIPPPRPAPAAGDPAGVTHGCVAGTSSTLTG